MPTDPLDDMPKIRLEKDDLDSFHRTRARAGNKSTNTENVEEIDKAQTNSSGFSTAWFVLLFLLLVIAGTGVYWSMEQHKVFTQAQNRITELENRLSATGEDMGQSTEALQVKLSELSAKTEDLWEQMDKLWASAWRRNQSEIAALNKTVMSLKTASEKSTQSLSNDIAANNTTVDLINEQIEQQKSMLTQLSQSISKANKVDVDFEQQLTSLREKLISTALANNDLTNQIDDLRRKVAVVEKKTKDVESLILGPTS